MNEIEKESKTKKRAKKEEIDRYYPGQKKKEPSSRFAARRTLFHV